MNAPHRFRVSNTSIRRFEDLGVSMEAVLRHAEGNQSKAADWLGINRNTLRRKLLDHKLLNHKAMQADGRTPVPAAVSSTLRGPVLARRAARSRA